VIVYLVYARVYSKYAAVIQGSTLRRCSLH